MRADISKVSNVYVLGMFGPLPAKKIKIVLRCGAELQAQISWIEDVGLSLLVHSHTGLNVCCASQGEEKRSVNKPASRVSSIDSCYRGPAQIVYDDPEDSENDVGSPSSV